MKSLLVLTIAFMSTIAQADQSSYETLRAAWSNADNRAPTLAEIPWATDAGTYWKGCTEYFKNGQLQPKRIILVKWTQKSYGGGPIFEKPTTKVNLLYFENGQPLPISNENLIREETSWSVTEDNQYLNILITINGDTSSNYDSIRTDGEYLYFSQYLPSLDPQGLTTPSYGYCWK